MTNAAPPDGSNKIKILVPINFSHKSERALDFALMYARHLNADIYLFHVFEDATSNYRQLDRLTEEYLDRMKQQVIQSVERLAKIGIEHTVDDVYRRIGGGKPAVEILKMASGIGADMIVMGASQTGALKKLLAQAPCTLVLVKDKDTSYVVPE
jgi:nucleotide-binding universal stress UspA family protein